MNFTCDFAVCCQQTRLDRLQGTGVGIDGLTSERCHRLLNSLLLDNESAIPRFPMTYTVHLAYGFFELSVFKQKVGLHHYVRRFVIVPGVPSAMTTFSESMSGYIPVKVRGACLKMV